MKTIKLIKTISILIVFLFSSLILVSQELKSQQGINTSEILFFDDFEETIGGVGSFNMWTSENIEGWHYWHIIDWAGFNSGQCMRFGNTDIDQNDWLITKPILYTNTDSVLITFDYNYNASKNEPKLLFTTRYNGNSAESNWTEIDYNLEENENEWYNSGDLVIENPGDTIYFAFHYQAEPDIAIYFLLDNFKAQSYVPPPTYELVGSSEHFEFYTNMIDNSDYFLEINDELENKYTNLTSLFDRPCLNNIFQEEEKIKVYYTNIENIPDYDENTPAWKCGFADANDNSIYLSPLITEDQINYYTNLSGLSINTFSKFAFIKKAFRDYGALFVPPYFLEGFGLLESGYSANRDSVIQCLSELGTNAPDLNSLTDISLLATTAQKDLLTTYMKSLVLINCYSYLEYGYGQYGWEKYLKYYYLIDDTNRIKLLKSTEHFNIYGNEKERDYMDVFSNAMEAEYLKDKNRYEHNYHHKVNVTLYEKEIGKEIINSTYFMGQAFGGDHLNMGPVSGADGSYGLAKHEYMHLLIHQFCGFGPGQFLNEGLAQYAGRGPMLESDIQYHLYKIQGLFFHYQDKYNREPTMNEIIFNTENLLEVDPFWVDVYYLGQLFWTYYYNKYGDYVKFREFISSQNDFSVWGDNTNDEEIEEFMHYFKELAFVGPPLEPSTLPFLEDFDSSFGGWSLLRYGTYYIWQNQPVGINGSYCAYNVDPYWSDVKDVDSWLISPPLNCLNTESIDVSFMYKQHGQGIKPEVYYAGNFTGAVDTVDWVTIEDLSWDANEGEWANMNFSIENATDRLNIAIRFISEEGNYASYLIDNFKVESTSTNTENLNLPQYEFKIYPNPITKQTIVSFNNLENGKVNLSIFDLQGRKIYTVVDNNMPQGKQTVSLRNLINENGIYFCTLTTELGIKTIKLVVNK